MIGRTGAQRDAAGMIHASDELPPLPTVSVASANETRFLPGLSVDAHVDPGDRRGARPGNSADRERPAADFLIRRGIADERSHALQRHRLANGAAVPFPLVPVFVRLIVPNERTVDEDRK